MALGKAHFVPLEQATDHELLYYYILLCVIQNCIVRFMFKSKYFLLKVCMINDILLVVFVVKVVS